MVKISIFNHWSEVSEPHLCGILCCMVHMFKDKPLFDIEVSFAGRKKELLPKSFPKCWTLSTQIQNVIEYCENLQKNGDPPMTVVSVDSGTLSYNIRGEDRPEFMLGFLSMDKFIKAVLENETCEEVEEENDGGVSEFAADSIFLSQSTLKKTVRDEPDLTRTHKLSVPAFLWDLPKITNIYQEQLASNLIALFLRDCSDDEHQKLIKKKSYLRFHLYQDESDGLPDSRPYVYGYIRNIDICTFKSHREALTSIPIDELPCEVNLSTNAFFWRFPVNEWLNKSVQHVYYFG